MTDPSSMRVVWNSRHNDDNPSVKWGTTPGGPYTSQAYADSYTYYKEDLCGEPAISHGWFWGGYWNYALMQGLDVGTSTVYYYVYGSATRGWSEEASFKAMPAPGAPVNIILCADMGVSTYDEPATDHWAEPDASETIRHMTEWATSGSGYDWSLALHSGDVSYATGYQLKWPLFVSAIQELGSRVPYNVSSFGFWDFLQSEAPAGPGRLTRVPALPPRPPLAPACR